MRRRGWWVIAGLAILGAPFAWYLGSPLFINRVVDEPFPTSVETVNKFPMSAGATVPEGMTKQQVEDVMREASKANASAAEPLPVSPRKATVVARGTFSGRDEFHRGGGAATVYRLGQEQVLRLDSFKVTNGPDLHVILTKHPAPMTRGDVQEGYVEIAKLKGNLGSQNYPLGQRVRPEEYRAVVIYCARFHVVFSTAALHAGQ